MKVLVSGYYGFGNAGDEAVLDGLLHSLRLANCAPGLEVTVLSADPGYTERVHGVEALERTRLLPIWRALREADLFISGGGGLLQDATSRRSPLYYLALIEMAHKAGTPVYLYGQGVGPLSSPAVLRAARAILPRAAGAGARDELSAQLLHRLGMDEEKVQLTADAAFALDPPPAVARAAVLEELALPFGRFPLVGVVWRPPLRRSGANLLPRVARAVAHLAGATGAGVVVMSFHPRVDRAASQELARAIAKERPEVPVFVPSARFEHRRWLALAAALDLAVTVRYHGLAFAAIGGVPALAIAYDPKVSSLAERLGVPWLPLEADADQLLEAVWSAWERSDELAEALPARVAELRAAALGEGRRCLEIAGAGASGGRPGNPRRAQGLGAGGSE